MPDDEPEYGLVMPFVATRSQGGPFDDDAFVSGWRCGALDALLAYPLTFRQEIEAREADLEQLDLIAMRRGFVMTTKPADDEWFFVTFTMASADG